MAYTFNKAAVTYRICQASVTSLQSRHALNIDRSMPPANSRQNVTTVAATSLDKIKKKSTVNENVILKIPDFDDHKEAYKSKNWWTLLRAFAVFQLCSVNSLVDRQLTILKWCRKLLGKTLFVGIMKKTLYGHFMGGETREEVLSCVQGHVQYGIQPLIAFTAAETHGITDRSDSDSETMRRFYADCVTSISDSIDYAHDMRGMTSVVPMVSSKLTFIKPHHIFHSTSQLISQNKAFIESTELMIDSDSERRDFNSMINELVKKQDRCASLDSAITSMDFHLKVHETAKEQFSSYVNAIQDIPVDLSGIESTVNVMEQLAQKAEELGVILIWDAEQTYLQTAMDVLTLDSMRSHNKKRAVVHNTYQCCLKNGFAKTLRDTNLAEQEGFCWGGKIVRGAYMDEERRLASQHGYEDPVNPSFEATTEMYHKTLDYILKLLTERQPGQINVTMATHNVDTVKYMLNRWKEINFHPTEHIRFAQLLGMRDNITYTLGQNNFPIAKLVHYGPVEDCVAYLSRRVKENRSGIATANYERQMLGREVMSRLKGRKKT